MRILILQAGFNEIGVILALKQMEHYVISIGNQVGLIGQAYCDEYHCMDYSKKEEVLNFVKENNIERICACCNDTAVLTAVYVAEQMKWDGYDTYENALIMCYKDSFKSFAMENNLCVINSVIFDDIAKVETFVKDNKYYPMIVKPADMSGGKGISRVDSEDELLEASKEAFLVSRNSRIIIEPFVTGTQHGFCTFLKDEKVVACCSNDEYSVVNPYRVEIDTFPATNIEKYQDILIEQVETIAALLHLEDGIFHLQYIANNDGIYILEVMRRIIGNMYAIPAGHSIDFDWDYHEARTNIGLGADFDDTYLETKKFSAYRAIIPPRNGVVKDIIIDDELKKYIFRREMFKGIGYKVEKFKEETLGILFMEFDSHEMMLDVMLKHYDMVQVAMEQME